MPDITMCHGSACPKHQRDRCHRFTATPTPERQAYFVDAMCLKNGYCEHFWDNAEWRDVIDPDAVKILEKLESTKLIGDDPELQALMEAERNLPGDAETLDEFCQRVEDAANGRLAL